MIITKYDHACFAVEHTNEILVVDPGAFSSDFVSSPNISVIVITHAHADHFDLDQLAAIFADTPYAVLVAPQAIIDAVPDRSGIAISAGDQLNVGAFDLVFYGGQHAEIHSSIPSISNVGVLINQMIYYPGDSFALPDQSIDVLALPAAAPWAKVSEIIDFLIAVKPRLAFPTHDAILSPTGQAVVDAMLLKKAQSINCIYQRIDAHPLEVA
jgi:L-ascorbate metabolism protein UlaG (beta-lactamase superfamily)